MDFFFLNNEVVEEVKQYVAKATQNAKTSTLPDTAEVAPPIAHAKVPSARAAEV